MTFGAQFSGCLWWSLRMAG